MTEPTERMVRKGVEAFRRANVDPDSPDTPEHKVTETYKAMESERRAEEAEKLAGLRSEGWGGSPFVNNLLALHRQVYGTPR